MEELRRLHGKGFYREIVKKVTAEGWLGESVQR